MEISLDLTIQTLTGWTSRDQTAAAIYTSQYTSHRVYLKPSIPAMTLPPAAARLFAWLNLKTIEEVMIRIRALAIITA